MIETGYQMKAFLISLAVLVIVAVGASFVLDNYSRPGETYFASGNVRLD